MKLFHLTGTGHFINDNGDSVNYPIRKLRIVTENDDFFEAKLDKANAAVLPFMYEKIGDPVDTIDGNGIACQAQEFEIN